MLKKKYTALSLVTTTAVAAVIGCMVGQTTKQDGEISSDVAENETQRKPSPARAVADRQVYYPGT